MSEMMTNMLLAALLACSGCGNKDTGQATPAKPQESTESVRTADTSGTRDLPMTKKTTDKSTNKVDEPVTQSKCAKIRKAIESRDFSGWNGLSADCDAGTLFDGIPDDVSSRPRRSLGTRRAEWVILKIDGYYRPMASFVDGKFVMFDAMNPTLSVPASKLQQELGEPAATENWWYGSLEMKDAAFVYPDKGITLFLNPDTHEALHIALYQPTDVNGWTQGLRPRLRKKMK